MGKHANSAAYRDWERQQSRKADEYFEPVEALTDDEIEQQYSDWHWDKQDTAPRSVRLWDEMETMRCAT
jgi:hypothetical protein